MNDRELLQRAANACGFVTSRKINAERLTLDPPVIGLWIAGVSTNWNPLKNDGDALRLAVKLELTVHQWADEICVCNASGTINEAVSKVGDIYAATRRAIVLAAAELGRDQ